MSTLEPQSEMLDSSVFAHQLGSVLFAMSLVGTGSTDLTHAASVVLTAQESSRSVQHEIFDRMSLRTHA